MADTLPYHLVDFQAVIKHAFYSGSDPEALHCEATDRTVNSWPFAAQRLLERYLEAWCGADASPRQLIIAHDMGRDYRTAVHPEYKVKRGEREQSSVEQAELDALRAWAKAFFSALGATQIGVKGVEADDVLAWLCQGIEGPKQVWTVDADLLALVDDTTLVWLKGEVCVPGGEHHGVPYPLTSIAKSIIGDASDHYGGVPQIGPAKFAQLLEAYGEDGIVELGDIVDAGDPTRLDAAISETGDPILRRLREHFATWTTMWRLAKLHPELCWAPRRRALTVPVIHKRLADGDKLRRLLVQAGADDLWPRLEPLTPRAIAVDADNWPALRETILAEIEAGDVTAFDVETADKAPHPAFLEAATGDDFVDMLSHRLTGASFTFGRHLENTIYVTVDHRDAANLPATVITELLEHAGRHTRLVVQNALFEGVISQTNLGLALTNLHDTRIMQRYVDENAEAGLKAMSQAYLGYAQASYRDTLGDKANMSELTLDEVFGYGCDDATVTGALYDLLKLRLQLDGQWAFYTRWAVRPTEVLQHSYLKGVDVNWALQARVHARDRDTLARSLEALRSLLAEHVTGEVTVGCKSFLDAERDYVRKGWRRKLRDQGLSDTALDEAVRAKLSDWTRRWESACRYLPYHEEAVMPRFAPTIKQLGEAAQALGLPAIERVSAKALTEYLMEHGMLGQGGEPPTAPAQQGFLEALRDALEADAFKIKDLEKALDAAWEAEDTALADKRERQLERAREAFAHLGDVVQTAMGVEPRIVKTGDELSLGSPQQMQQLLYAKIGVPVRLRSSGALGKGRLALGLKENGPATDEKAIRTALANDVEDGSWQAQALEHLLEAKTALTRIQLYHQKWPLWRHPLDGRIHPTFLDAGTDTRRPTGKSPNMLQVSKKDKVMREMFVTPGAEWVVVAIDYASQEIRLMAEEADDPVMKSVYDPEHEKDLHSMTGSAIAGMPYEAFAEALADSGHERHALVQAIRARKAKGVNFGLAYGAGAATVSRNLIVPLEEAKRLLDDAFGLYRRIKPWQEETAAFMDKHGYTLTAFGTKRHATADLFSSDSGKRSRQHRQGTNATIQGTAAEMLRIVLTKIAERGLLERLQMVFVAPIYDEVVSFVHADDVVEYCREMRDIMQSATPPTHSIPQVPEFSIGATWGTVKELGRWPGEAAIEAAVARALEEGAAIRATDLEEAA